MYTSECNEVSDSFFLLRLGIALHVAPNFTVLKILLWQSFYSRFVFSYATTQTLTHVDVASYRFLYLRWVVTTQYKMW